MKKITLAVVSDLHYRKHGSDLICRPAIAMQGTHADPMASLIAFLEDYKGRFGESVSVADYLICPGDISDRGSHEGFDEGWSQLKQLQLVLGASHLLAATGNHEVDSRVSVAHDTAGNAELNVDPIQALQRHDDYPSTLLAGSDRRWIYWGRGYEFIEEEAVLFLLINTSHYHSTTRTNEFERGRIGDIALRCLREEMKLRVNQAKNKLFVAIMHHHPVPHQDLDVDLGKIEMDNGARLMEVFAESDVSWLILHGHKHFPRLVRGQSSTGAIVFAAGSLGAHLHGTLAAKTQPQFYLIDAFVVNQDSQPEACGSIRAFSWSGSKWDVATQRNQGLPDRCGYRVPQLDISVLAKTVKEVLDGHSSPFVEWSELVELVPSLGNLLPEETRRLEKSLRVAKVNTVWPDENWFPTDVAKDRT